MPVFLSTLTTPAGTSKGAPAAQTIMAIPGILTLLRLYVPPGPRGELFLRLMHGGVQLLPARAGTWIRPDDDIIAYPLEWSIGQDDVLFQLQGASPNANFQHQVDFELTVLSADVIGAGGSTPQSLLDRVRGLFG